MESNVYEEERAKNIARNMRILKECGLTSPIAARHKLKAPTRKREKLSHGTQVSPRRSARLSNLPTPLYKEDLPEKISQSRRSHKWSTATVVKLAEKLSNPTLLKIINCTSVSGLYVLILQGSDFCTYLPQVSRTLTFQDAADANSVWHVSFDVRTKYLGPEGWKDFVLEKDVKKGDFILLEAVGEATLKVHIFPGST